MPYQETAIKPRHQLSGDEARLFDIEHIENLVSGDAVPQKLLKGSKAGKDQRRTDALRALIKKMQD